MEDPMNRVKAFGVPAYALRHGSPDKVPASAFPELEEFYEISCPECGSILCIDASILAVSPEFECAGCGDRIALNPDGSLRAPLYEEPKAVGNR
jgi:ribosomal protein S27E